MGKKRNKDQNIIVGLDIGTTKICAVVAEEDKDGKQRVIGIGTSPSNGLRKGIVVNIESTVESITRAIEAAEEMSSIEICSVFAGIAGSHIKSFNSSGVIPIAHDDGEINKEDMHRAIEAAKAISIPLDREVIHVIPQEYTVDGQEGIKDPLGMYGVKLEANVHVVTAAVTSAQNVIKCITTAGFEVEDIVLEPLASSIATLTKDEKESGVILIDIGGGTTDFVVFTEGVIRYADVLGVGGINVTNDISVGLKIPIAKAEETKKRFGCAFLPSVDDSEEFMVPGVVGRKSDSMRRRDLAEIVQMRMEEIFVILKKEIKKSGYSDKIGAGIVLTGGASLLSGSIELAQNVFNVPVRIGRPKNMTGLVEVLDSPIYATGVGLAQYGFSYRVQNKDMDFRGRNIFSKVFRRMKDWYSEYF